MTAEARKIIDAAEYWHYEFKLPWKTTVPGKPGWADRVEKRKKHFFNPLLEHYGGKLSGKTVLDLGCCQGYWSFAAEAAGAQSVLAVDSSPHFIREAIAVKTVLGIQNISFREGHLEEPWSAFLDVRKQVVLLLGTLFHATDPIFVLRNALENTLETIVIDGEVVNKPEPAFFMVDRTPEDPATIRSRMKSPVRLIPTAAAIIRFIELAGFRKITLLWPDDDMPKDYHQNTTVSIMASR